MRNLSFMSVIMFGAFASISANASQILSDRVIADCNENISADNNWSDCSFELVNYAYQSTCELTYTRVVEHKIVTLLDNGEVKESNWTDTSPKHESFSVRYPSDAAISQQAAWSKMLAAQRRVEARACNR